MISWFAPFGLLANVLTTKEAYPEISVYGTFKLKTISVVIGDDIIPILEFPDICVSTPPDVLPKSLNITFKGTESGELTKKFRSHIPAGINEDLWT